MKTTKIDKIVDLYFKEPFIIDGAIILIVVALNIWAPLVQFKIPDKTAQLNIIWGLIGADVSLAGFILAALTIIVTFKSNIKARGTGEIQNNALDMLLSTHHYQNLVRVFRSSIKELVAVLIFLLAVWLSCQNIDAVILQRMLVSSVIISVLALCRSLWALYRILELGFIEKE